jgi:hypothetical protein
MLTISNPRSHALILGAIIAVVVPARIALKPQHALERRTIENQARKQSSHELAAGWNSLRYTNTESGNLTEAFLAKIEWESLTLSDLQKAKLGQQLKELLGYLRNPTFEEYYRLKTEGLHWQLQLTNRVPKSLPNWALIAQGNPNPAPPDFVKSLWNSINAHRSGNPHRITAICLDRIGIETSHTNSPHAIMGGKASIGFTMAQAAIDPGFRYVAPDRSPATDSTAELFVHLSFYAHSNVSDDAGPVYLSLYWSDVDQNWALSRMFTDVLLRMNTLF